MSDLSPSDIFDLQVAIADAIAASSDDAHKAALRKEMAFYQTEKAKLIAAANDQLVALLAERIARLEEIIGELGQPSLLVPVRKFRGKAGVPKSAPIPEVAAAAPAEAAAAAERTIEERFGLTPDLLRHIQETLTERGIYAGPINGLYDDATRAAIRGFQRANALNDDGVPGRKTQSALWPEPIAEQMEQPAPETPVTSSPPAPAVHPGATAWPDESRVTAFFGQRTKNQTLIDLPYTMRIAWDLRQKTRRLSCHEKVAAPLGRIFANMLSEYGEDRLRELGLDLYAGCFNNRLKQGGDTWSMHAWAIAVDIDSARNQLKWDHTRAEFAKPAYEPFWRIVEAEGAVSLGRAKDYDWMHFQFARP